MGLWDKFTSELGETWLDDEVPIQESNVTRG